MRKNVLLWIMTTIMALLICASAPPEECWAGASGSAILYVDRTGGDDNNDGTLGSPYATLNKAVTTAQNDYPGHEVIVYLKAGDYTASEYITHANLTITAFSDRNGNYDVVTIYPDYDTTLPTPNQLWSSEWIFATDNLMSKVGFTLSHVNLSGDNPDTAELEDGSTVTGFYIYSADGTGTYFTLDNCTISNMQYGVIEKYSDFSTLSILNCDINAYSPVSLDSSPSLIIHDSTLKMTCPESWGSVINLNGTPSVNIQGNTVIGNNGVGRGIYEDIRSGTISNNTFRDLDIALELCEIGNLTASNNYVETTNNGFDLETLYYSPATITVNDNTIINKTLKNAYQTGVKLYLNDGTGGSTFNVYGNEIVNFTYGLYYDGDSISDTIGLNLSNEGAGNKFRGNLLNLYIEVLRSTSKLDMRYIDWGTTDRQEIFDRIYFREVYPSSDSATAAATHEDAFLFDDAFTTTAMDTVYVDDDYTSITPGFRETHFNSISEAKSWVKSGGTINVAEGLYDEQVFIFQPVIIHGAGENTVMKNTAVDESKPIMLIAAPDTTVRGLNFQENTYGLMVGDFDYCQTHLNNPVNFTYYDSMANNTTVYQNYFGNQSYASIYIDYQNYPDTLDGLTVEANTFNSDTRSSYYALHSRNDFVINSPIIKDNQIAYGYMNGFYLKFAEYALFQGNDIVIDGVFAEPFGNKVGLLLFPEGNGLITDNTIHLAGGIDHAPSANDSIGIRYDVGATPAELITADFYNNSISGFDYALYYYGYEVNLPEGSIDVTVGGSNEHYNDLRNNTYGVVSQYQPVSIDASYNLWGVDDEGIPNMILDNNDQTYYGVINYLPSADLTPANPVLSNLQVSPISLTPAFDTTVTEYTASVTNEVTAINVTPSTETGIIYINDNQVTSGSSVEIPLAAGKNSVIIKVENGQLSSVYTLSVTRESPPTSGGGGGSSSPSINVTTEEDSNSTTNKTEVAANHANGTASANISSVIIDALLDKAKSTKGTLKKDVLEVAVDAEINIQKLKASIPQNDIAKIANETDANLALTSPFISVAFDGKALEAISKADTGSDVIVSASVIDKEVLSESDMAKVADRPVYDFTVMNGNTQVSHFGGGHATVTIPYQLKPGENPITVVIYYLADDGSLKTVRGHYDATKKAVVLKTPHFSKFAIGHNPVSFSDVPADAWHREGVEFIAARGITSGTGDHKFSPNARLTRAQFVVLLMNAYQINTQGGEFNEIQNFSDAGNTYYTDYLLAAKGLGIVNGLGNNLFAPEKEITRQEMSVILYNALQLLDEVPDTTLEKQLTSFNDANQIAVWAKEAMTKFVKGGIVSGSNDNLNPAVNITRAEIAQVLYNLLGK